MRGRPGKLAGGPGAAVALEEGESWWRGLLPGWSTCDTMVRWEEWLKYCAKDNSEPLCKSCPSCSSPQSLLLPGQQEFASNPADSDGSVSSLFPAPVLCLRLLHSCQELSSPRVGGDIGGRLLPGRRCLQRPAVGDRLGSCLGQGCPWKGLGIDLGGRAGLGAEAGRGLLHPLAESRDGAPAFHRVLASLIGVVLDTSFQEVGGKEGGRGLTLSCEGPWPGEAGSRERDRFMIIYSYVTARSK